MNKNNNTNNPPATRRLVDYATYIRIPDLLKLQNADLKGGLNHHEEHLFILVHQNFELWFKQILWDLESVKDIMIKGTSPPPSSLSSDPKLSMSDADLIAQRLDRCDRILRNSLNNFDIIETMTPSDFLEFRDFIGPASGFQSRQMRELEILLGLSDSERILCSGQPYIASFSGEELQILNKRKQEPTILDCVNKWLASFPVPPRFKEEFVKCKLENLSFQKRQWMIDEAKIERAIEMEMRQIGPFMSGEEYEERPLELHEAVMQPQGPSMKNLSLSSSPQNQNGVESEAKEQRSRIRIAALFITAYRHHPDMSRYARILDLIVGLEEGLMVWRAKHVRMVERMIGRRLGTGGSSGVDYLQKTTEYRIFKDLWRMRSLFVKSSSLPPLEQLMAL